MRKQHLDKGNIPVSRKTNEEIDEDQNGNLIIGGEIISDKTLKQPNKPISKNEASVKDSLTDNQKHHED